MLTRLKGPRLGTAIVILAVALIPLLYAGLLTMTYQNPTNRLADMKAAIVNEDQPYTGTLVTGKTETFSLGSELTDALVNPESGEDVGFTWKEMDEKDAKVQLNDERIRAILYIPHDFSQNVAKIGTDIGSSATQELRLVTDDGVNYLSGTMAKTVSEAMTNRINERGSTRITERLLISIEKVREGLADASDGSTKLADGTTKLTDGVEQFTDGINKLADGTGELTAGTGRIVVGMNDLLNGTVRLDNGLTELNSGATRAADGSQKLSLGLTQLDTGLSQATTGSTTLHNGANELATGIGVLATNADKLGNGVNQLAQGANQLVPAINAYTTGVDQAYAGTAQLQRAAGALPSALTELQTGLGNPGDYDPQNPQSATTSLTAGAEALQAGLGQLHAGLTQANGQQPSLQQGASKLADATQFLATSLDGVDVSDVPQLAAGAKKLDASLAQYTGGVDQLAAACLPKQSPLCQGLAQLSASSKQIRDGSNALADATGTVATKIDTIAQFKGAMHSVADGAQSLKNGVDQVTAGSEKLNQGSTLLTANLAKASTGVNELATKVGTPSSTQDGTLMGAINDLHGGLGQISGQNSAQSAQLRAGATSLGDGIGQLNGKMPELTGGITKLDAGAHQLADGASTLNSGLSQLSSGATTAANSSQELAEGLGVLKNGVGTAANGSNQLLAGVHTANDGVGTLNTGAHKLNDGTRTASEKVGELSQGATKLDQGATELRDGLHEGADKIPHLSKAEQTNVSGTAGQVAKVTPMREHAVANNGAGFTPMFMSLALWIGTIALFLVLPALDHDERARGRWVQAVTKPAVTATILAVIQAVIMMVVVNVMGELQAANIVGLCALAVLTSICFMAINQACVAAFAFRGRFLSIVLLSLQITSMGATFPIETAPKFFQWIHQFLPMSDTQLAFRSLIAGGGVDGIIVKTVAILIMWTVVSVAISFFASKVRIAKNTPAVLDEALAPTAG